METVVVNYIIFLKKWKLKMLFMEEDKNLQRSGVNRFSQNTNGRFSKCAEGANITYV